MSNRICFEPTEFKSVRSGDVTFGYRVYDDHASTYGNLFESIPDDDLDFLEQVIACKDITIDTMLDFVREHEGSIYIGDVVYEYEQIKHLL